MRRKSELALVEKKPELPSINMLNFNNAEQYLRDIIPTAHIEYLVSNDIKGYNKGWLSFNLGYQKQKVRIVLLAMKFSRILWDKFNPSIQNPVPLCKSDDGNTSSGGTLFAAGTTCQNCEKSRWADEPPKCAEVYSLLCYDLSDEIPFVIPVKRTSIYPLRKLKTALKLNGKKFAYSNIPVNLCVSVLLRTEPVENYFIVSFPQRDAVSGDELWQRLSKDEALRMKQIADGLLGSFHEMGVQETATVEPQAPIVQ